MILDANVLLYAVDTTARGHDVARELLDRRLNGDVRVGIPSQSLAAFLRIATHPRVMESPMAPAAATAVVADWLDAPAAWLPDVTRATWSITRTLIETHGVTGNLVPDAQLAALAIQHGVAVVSADTDFARFPEARWENPFAAA